VPPAAGILASLSAIKSTTASEASSRRSAARIVETRRRRNAATRAEKAAGEVMKTHQKERERLKEAMSKSLAASPKRQQEIAEMLKNRLGVEDRKPAQSNSKKGGKK